MRITVIAFVTLSFLTSTSLFAHADQAGEKLFKDCVEALKKAKTMRLEYVVTQELGEFNHGKVEVHDIGTMLIQRPDQFYEYNVHKPTSAKDIIYCDGKNLIYYSTKDKTYRKRGLESGPEEMTLDGWFYYRPDAMMTLHHRGKSPVVRSSVTIAGQKCQVLEISVFKTKYSFYVNAHNFIQQYVCDDGPGGIRKFEAKTLKIDENLPQDKMQWKPPADAKADILSEP